MPVRTPEKVTCRAGTHARLRAAPQIFKKLPRPTLYVSNADGCADRSVRATHTLICCVQHDGQRVNMVGFQIAVHDEPRTITGDIVGKSICGRDGCAPVELKERHGLTGGE